MNPVGIAGQLLSYLPGGATGGLAGLLLGLWWWNDSSGKCPLGSSSLLALDCVRTPFATFTSMAGFGAVTTLAGAIVGVVVTAAVRAGHPTD